MVSKMWTMYETNRPSTLINDTRWLLHFGSWGRVRSAMPNRPFSLSPFAYKVDVQIFGRIPDCFGWFPADFQLKFRISPGFPARNFADFPIKFAVRFESKSGSICISTIKLSIKAKKFNGNPNFHSWFAADLQLKFRISADFFPPDSGQKFGH